MWVCRAPGASGSSSLSSCSERSLACSVTPIVPPLLSAVLTAAAAPPTVSTVSDDRFRVDSSPSAAHAPCLNSPALSTARHSQLPAILIGITAASRTLLLRDLYCCSDHCCQNQDVRTITYEATLQARVPIVHIYYTVSRPTRVHLAHAFPSSLQSWDAHSRLAQSTPQRINHLWFMPGNRHAK